MSTPTSTEAQPPTCTTAVPGKYGAVPPDACNSGYSYEPNFGANVVFCVLFSLSTIAHIAQAVLHKKKFAWVLIMGALWEAIVFALRSAGARDQQNTILDISNQLIFQLAPLWVNAFAYMTIARLIYFVLPEKKIWRLEATRLAAIFVWLDVICFIVQGSGGGILSAGSDQDTTKLGTNVFIFGIGLQLAFVISFAGITVFFCRQLQPMGSYTGRLKYLIWTILFVLLMIATRNTFRLIEFAAGYDENNVMLNNEEYPLMLDGFPMLLACLALNVLHPGLVLRGPDSEFPRFTRAEKKVLKQKKKEEKLLAKQAKEENIRTDNIGLEERGIGNTNYDRLSR